MHRLIGPAHLRREAVTGVRGRRLDAAGSGRAAVQVGDLASGPGQLRAQLRRVQNLDLRPQCEQVEHRSLDGVDPDPGLGPVAAACRGGGSMTDPEGGGRPCRAASRWPRGDNRIRARPAPGAGRWRSPRRLPGSSLLNPSMSSKPPRGPRVA